MSAFETMNEYAEKKIPFLFIVDFDMLDPLVYPIKEVNPDDVWYDIDGKTNQMESLSTDKKFFFKKKPPPFASYLDAFHLTLNQIKAGNTYLLNLTFRSEIETDLTHEEIFLMSKSRYKLMLRNRFVVFSPESFVKIKGRTISAFPMKGTIDADFPDAEKIILEDKKEHAEHATIVDLLRNDLSIVANHVDVPEFRYVEKISTSGKDLLQVSSEVTGELRDNFIGKPGSVLSALLPAGSVTGAPKKKTVELIRSIENYKRGYFTGVFGYYGNGSLDSAVMIRFIEKTPEGHYFKSGGGITCFSNPVKEYSELEDKIYLPVPKPGS